MPSSRGPDLSGSGGTLDCVQIVRRIQGGDSEALTELYNAFSGGLRFFTSRRLGTHEIEDKVHDTFLVVVEAIRRGEVRDPDRLMAFVRTVMRRQIAGYIARAVQTRRDHTDLDAGFADARSDPEQNAIGAQHEVIMKEVLSELSARDCQVLTRFYLHEQSQEQICDELGLTETQFRLLKSRAKAKFTEMVRRKLRK
jgi:RNA polymerase sigma factor (sigma-70 family)